jgi:hypothetical protein
MPTWTPRIVGLEIMEYPEKLLYVISVDSELSLKGGVVRFLHEKSSPSDPFSLDDKHQIDIIHDIDFTKEGVYIVTLYRNENATVFFPIQVVSLETLDHIVHANIG